MSRAEELLACTLTYRAAQSRATTIPTCFDSSDEVVELMKRVLLHEARESVTAPMQEVPGNPYLHPVDVDTDEPGIVDKSEDEKMIVRRYQHTDVPRVSYPKLTTTEMDATPVAPMTRSKEMSTKEEADKALQKMLTKVGKKAATDERRAQKQRLQKEERAKETTEDRNNRLEESRRKREEKGARNGGDGAQKTKKTNNEQKSAMMGVTTEDALLIDDGSLLGLSMPRKRRRGDKQQYYEHPLPHHRHMQGLQFSDPSDNLLPALLQGRKCDQLEIIQGPPGTGKTEKLVAKIIDFPARRIFLCAPTNVGACNIYRRCLANGWDDECALVMPIERVPLGTVVHSHDPQRRLVCGTISSRSGSMLKMQSFDVVLVDEAAQCMEAWVWTLLRSSVTDIVLAGDVKQLPARVSESGRALRHDRSLMERLVVDLKYDNVITLSEQNRMAPQLLEFPNEAFYGGVLTSGLYAPTAGAVELVTLFDACEEQSGTSFVNRREVEEIASFAKPGMVIITPYIAQWKLLLSMQTGCEVHTIDSFQGREADTIVLSIVRDGCNGLGFWTDARRLTVALTRARTRLIIVASQPHQWPTDSVLSQAVAAANKNRGVNGH